MSPEKQRIAIAEACGWEWCEILGRPCDPPYRALFMRGSGRIKADMDAVPCSWPWVFSEGSVPDFLSDLNAMHKAEETLTKNQGLSYYTTIGIICDFDERRRLCATAAQRAEAFLRTIGKWEDAP